MHCKSWLISISLAAVFSLAGLAADTPATPPGGFTFAGTWNCNGSFVGSGKAHRSTYEGRNTAEGDWIELVETDLEPKGYIGHYLIGYDAKKKQVVELDAYNGGYAIFTSPGWQERSLTLTSAENVVPQNRFVFEAKAADAFSVTWETNGGSEWKAADRLNCQRGSDADELPSSVYLQPQVQTGDKLSTIFSEAISYRAAGFDDSLDRASGTADYVVTESTPDAIGIDITSLMDGKSERKGHAEIREQGRTACQKGKCSPTKDASGLVYNATLWGVPPASLRKGISWEVAIAEPWELGPGESKETVTVLAVDAANHSVTLQREGSGEGPFDNDDKQVHLTKDGKSYVADMNPGRSHWKGYTTFREGIVISDELLVERPVTFSSKDLGSLNGSERVFILLNARPAGA